LGAWIRQFLVTAKKRTNQSIHEPECQVKPKITYEISIYL